MARSGILFVSVKLQRKSSEKVNRKLLVLLWGSSRWTSLLLVWYHYLQKQEICKTRIEGNELITKILALIKNNNFCTQSVYFLVSKLNFEPKLNVSKLIVHYTCCNTQKRVTSWRSPSLSHYARAPQLFSKKCCSCGEPLATLSDLIGRRFETQTSRSRDERVTPPFTNWPVLNVFNYTNSRYRTLAAKLFWVMQLLSFICK